MSRSSRRRGRPPHANASEGFWHRLSPTSRHAASLLILLVASISFFAPVHFDGKGLHGSDIVNWRGMAEAMIEYQEETGEDALWAPNAFAGMPGYLIKYEHDIPQLDTIVDAARSFAWPTSHLFLMLAGAYLLGFFLTRNHFSSLLTGLAFGFTTYMPIILAAGHQTKFVALAYAPWVLLAFAYTLRRPGLLGGLLFAIALALQLRAKHPQITYYVLMLAFVWWIAEMVSAWRKGEMQPVLASTGWLALGTVGALAMVVQPYWPTWEYKQFSVRGAVAGAADGGGGNMGWENAMRWSQGPKELFTLAIADAYGGAQYYWGPKPFTAGPHYVGAVVIALAGIAAYRVRTRTVIGLGTGALVTALFAMGRHAPWINRPMFEVFPYFDAFRAPETWLSITALALAALAGIGLDDLLRRSTEKSAESAKTKATTYAFGAAVVLIGLLYAGGEVVFDFEKPSEEARITQALQRQYPNVSPDDPRMEQTVRRVMEQRRTERVDAFESDALRSLLALLVAGGVLVFYRRGTVAPWIAGTAVLAVVAVDLWGVDSRYLGDDDFSPSQSAASQVPTYSFDRFLKEKQREAGGPGHFRVLPLSHPAGLSPMNNGITSYHYESLGGYHGAKLQRYQDFIDHILRVNRGMPNENAIDLLNARYVVSQQQLPGTEVVARDDQTGILILRNPDAVPRGFFVGQTKVIEDAEATWQRLRSDAFSPRRTAILPEPLDAPVTPVDSASTTRAELRTFTPPEIEWTVETDAPRLFVASEIYYPAGWNAYLDGEPVPIHRVNYLLRGVHVPAGEHTLTMRFEPASDRIGTYITAVSTALVYGGVAWLVAVPYYRRRLDDEDTPDEGGEG